MIVLHDQTIEPKKVASAKLDKSGYAACYLSISYKDGSSDILRYEGEGYMEEARADLETLVSYLDTDGEPLNIL